MDVGRVSARDTATSLWKEVQDDDVTTIAQSLAYQFLLAIFPFLIFVVALGGLVAQVSGIVNPTQRLLDALKGTLPPDAYNLLATQLDSLVATHSGGLLSIGVLGAIWAASGGVRSVSGAMNRAYDVEETRPLWRRYLLSIVLVLASGAGLFLSFIVLIGGQVLGRDLIEALGAGRDAAGWINLARLPVILGLAMLAIAILYWAAPNIDIPFRWVSPGAVLFVLAWFAATIAFGFYVQNFGSYNATYGALGGVVVLLLWAYLSAFLLVAGAELNAILHKQAAPARLSAQGAETHLPAEVERERHRRAG
ncbi:MAG: YihY/virulence factor BrkB family protein [Dehalococcoidia bacterium]